MDKYSVGSTFDFDIILLFVLKSAADEICANVQRTQILQEIILASFTCYLHFKYIICIFTTFLRQWATNPSLA